MTVTFVRVSHPIGDLYLILVLPPVNPLSAPDVLPMVPTLRLLLVHVPPAGSAVTVWVVPLHIAVTIETVGVSLTVTTVVTSHAP